MRALYKGARAHFAERSDHCQALKNHCCNVADSSSTYNIIKTVGSSTPTTTVTAMTEALAVMQIRSSSHLFLRYLSRDRVDAKELISVSIPVDKRV